MEKDNTVENGFITDIAYNFYGNTKAISTTSKLIYIYKKQNSIWILSTSLKCEKTPLRIEFSPKYNENILAVCYLSNTISIWTEELNSSNNPSKWIDQKKNIDIKYCINDICFLPKTDDLCLACATQGGYFTVVKLNINNIETSPIKKCDTLFKGELSSISVNQSLDEPTTIAVGCKENNDSQGYIKIFCYDDYRQNYILIGSLKDGHKSGINDLEFAEQMGRSYMLLASVSNDKRIIIWKITLIYTYDNDKYSNINMKYEKILDDISSSPVWRVSWNNTGIYLAVASEEKTPLVYRKDGSEHFIKLDIKIKPPI